MIANLSGVVMSRSTDSIVLGVGGVGIRIQCGSDVLNLASPSESLSVSTSLIVREDSLTLFGFIDEQGRELFDTLLSVSGVGPKVALSMISSLGASGLIRAIKLEDKKTLTTVPGIGPKVAGRIVLELANKLSSPNVESVSVGENSAIGSSGDWEAKLHEALIGLGWTTMQAELALVATSKHVDATQEFDPEQDLSSALSFALRSMVSS